jgi:hypothetical protein
MGLHVDPFALRAFADEAAGHAQALRAVQMQVNLSGSVLGSFEEAAELAAAINSHTAEVDRRLQASAEALWGLARAAAQAAELAGSSDADVSVTMRGIDRQVDDARRRLAPRTG